MPVAGRFRQQPIAQDSDFPPAGEMFRRDEIIAEVASDPGAKGRHQFFRGNEILHCGGVAEEDTLPAQGCFQHHQAVVEMKAAFAIDAGDICAGSGRLVQPVLPIGPIALAR